MVYDVPTDPGWRRVDEEREGEDFFVQVLKLSRVDARLVLIAKDYTGDVDEDLKVRDWHAQYAQIFETVTNISITDGKHTLIDRVVDALDVVAEGTNADDPQRIRERYASLPGHKLIITAAGTVAAHEQFARDVDRWFDGIAFRPSR